MSSEFSVADLEREEPQIFNLEYMAGKINDGTPVRDWEVKSLTAKHNGSLEKYLIQYRTDAGTYYITRNTNYQMRPAFENLQTVHEQLLDNSVPRPVAYDEKLEALLYKEMPGINFIDGMAKATEEERISFFRKAGVLARQLHNVDTSKIHQDSNEANCSIEMIMRTINRDSFSEIQKYDPEFYGELKEVYDIVSAHEQELRSSVELVCNHGDLHPANLIISEKEGVGMVDFTDVAIAPRARDVGGFLEQTR